MEVASKVAEAHNCELSHSLFAPDYYPPTVNDAALWESFVAPQVSAAGELMEVPPTLAGEDFSFFAKEVPSAFLLLGQGSGGGLVDGIGDGVSPDTNFGLHHPRFAIHEQVLNTGVALHAHLALSSLRELSA